MKFVSPLMAVGLALVALPALADDLCAHISAFERADFASTDQSPRRRWIEYHLSDAGILTGRRSCTSSGDAAARDLCAYLLEHSSIEFPDRLPRGILVCHGYRFPDLSYWSDWKAEIGLENGSNRNLLLEIDQMARTPPDAATRLSVFPPGQDNALQPLPPLFKGKDTQPADR